MVNTTSLPYSYPHPKSSLCSALQNTPINQVLTYLPKADVGLKKDSKSRSCGVIHGPFL